MALIRAMNPSGKLRLYPGSPYCAEKTMREQDRLRLFELHPRDVKMLVENFRKLEAHEAAQGRPAPVRGKRVMVSHADGFTGLKALLPPPSRRAEPATERGHPPRARPHPSVVAVRPRRGWWYGPPQWRGP